MKKVPWGPKLRIASPDEPRTLTDVTLKRLRRDIVSGRFEAGRKLRTQELSKAYNVGNSPLREALFQLVGDGLVLFEGQRGFHVATLDADELEDITHWRICLETDALKRSIELGNVKWEAEVIAAFHRLKHSDYNDLDEAEAADQWEDRHSEFHFALYAACGSPWLLHFCEMLNEHSQRYRRAFVSYREIEPSITQEHQEILNAVIKRDSQTAATILEAHIRHAAEIAKSFLTRRAVPPAP